MTDQIASSILPKRIRSTKHLQEDNNNVTRYNERQQARTFIAWYKQMVDDERDNLALYLADDVVLEWFGRTIKTRKKVSSFLKFDMQCSRHDFTSVESIDRIKTREEKQLRKEDSVLASPLDSPEIKKNEKTSTKRVLRSNCNSPEWADGNKLDEECKTVERKRFKSDNDFIDLKIKKRADNKFDSVDNKHTNVNNKGDGLRGSKRKCASLTPPNQEVGQGDCLPSTSGTDSDKSHETLNAQLPRLAVECNGYIEFTRSRNNRISDSMKWERKCKVQISYSEDPLNIGEYILWALHYTDESKCRRNLLAAFEEAAKEENKT